MKALHPCTLDPGFLPAPPQPDRSIPIICLMGPTASGKTQLAIELVQKLPCDIISVDSAMVYQGMDIGTAKPDKQQQAIAPHRLLDIADPAKSYSAGQFCEDARFHIRQILAQDRIPLLVGGTMLYFRSLQQGLSSSLPQANLAIRQHLSEQAAKLGWQALHQRLCEVDPVAGTRIDSHDKQRIQRALEIYEITGHPCSTFWGTTSSNLPVSRIINIAIIPNDRALLHQRIQDRFSVMLKQGFVEEVEKLYHRGDLSPDLPSLRAVGYRQIYSFLAGHLNAVDMEQTAIAATRQLAKRQMTWLRSWPNLLVFSSEQDRLVDQITQVILREWEKNY